MWKRKKAKQSKEEKGGKDMKRKDDCLDFIHGFIFLCLNTEMHIPVPFV